MPENTYAIVAGIMRYIFVILGVLIVLRAFFMLRRDRKETRRMLRRLPDAGNVGELTVIRGCEEYPEGTVFPVPREGVLGSLRSCDLTVCASGIRKNHLDFIFENGLGLLVSPRSGCSAFVDGIEFNCRTASERRPMIHGSVLQIGDLVFRLRLFAGVDIERNARFTDEPETPAYPLQELPPEAGYSAVDASDGTGWQFQKFSGLPPVQQDINVPDSRNVLPPQTDASSAAPRRRRRSERWESDWDE